MGFGISWGFYPRKIGDFLEGVDCRVIGCDSIINLRLPEKLIFKKMS